MSYNTNLKTEENLTHSAQLSSGIPFTMASSAKPTVAASESISKPKTVKQYLQQQQQQQSATSRRGLSQILLKFIIANKLNFSLITLQNFVNSFIINMH